LLKQFTILAGVWLYTLALVVAVGFVVLTVVTVGFVAAALVVRNFCFSILHIVVLTEIYTKGAFLL
jgi:hypothetical protein